MARNGNGIMAVPPVPRMGGQDRREFRQAQAAGQGDRFQREWEREQRRAGQLHGAARQAAAPPVQPPTTELGQGAPSTGGPSRVIQPLQDPNMVRVSPGVYRPQQGQMQQQQQYQPSGPIGWGGGYGGQPMQGPPGQGWGGQKPFYPQQGMYGPGQMAGGQPPENQYQQMPYGWGRRY